MEIGGKSYVHIICTVWLNCSSDITHAIHKYMHTESKLTSNSKGGQRDVYFNSTVTSLCSS